MTERGKPSDVQVGDGGGLVEIYEGADIENYPVDKPEALFVVGRDSLTVLSSTDPSEPALVVYRAGGRTDTWLPVGLIYEVGMLRDLRDAINRILDRVGGGA